MSVTPIKVLHTHTLPVVSGSGINTWLSMRGQQAAGYQVELACAPGGGLQQLVEQEGMGFRAIPSFRQPIRPWHDLYTVWVLWRLCRRERYTIVHTHNSKAGFVGRLAAWLARTPIIVHTVHGFAFHAHEPWYRRTLFRWLERIAAQWCHQLIVISEPLMTWAESAHIATRERMIKIYSGIEVEAFQQPIDVAALRTACQWPSTAVVIGEVAKLWAGKGHDVLLHATAQLREAYPEILVTCIGEGRERMRLEALIRTLDLSSHVQLLGFRHDVPQLTQAIDIAVLPSLFEGMGRAVLEAMAAGKPVVASRVGGIVELVDEGITGFLVEPNDPTALASALGQLLHDPALRDRMGRAGRAKLATHFHAQVMSDQILAVYRHWLTQRGIICPSASS